VPEAYEIRAMLGHGVDQDEAGDLSMKPVEGTGFKMAGDFEALTRTLLRADSWRMACCASPGLPRLTRADAEGMACWLFTFAPHNVPIYEHLGFRVTLDTLLPSSGLRLWVMAHPPRVQP
jgi:hypothetical protein